ncbi:hypothetical protein HDR61_04335 [bacterium]|nr:hypothetical protein [bacterium]
MNKALAIFLCLTLATTPVISRASTPRPEDGGIDHGTNQSQLYLCTTMPEKCPEYGTTKTHAKKKSDTGKIVLISVAAGAVFAGAMYYIFKKTPSETNPGLVKLAEF